ncbi:MAG: TetR/AcrR family transcriptional regulator [Actinomycetota bacterium]
MTDDDVQRPRGRPKTFDRAHTLDVATQSWWRDGIDGISLNEICRRAGVSKPGVYREFGNEDQLMDAALTHYVDTVLASALASLSAGRPFQETLDGLVAYATHADTPEMPAGCLFAGMRNQQWRLGPVTSAHVDRLRVDAVAAYAAWLQRCVDAGEIELRASAEVTAAFVEAQLTMMLTRTAAGDDPEALRDHARLAFAVLTDTT